MSCAGGCAAIEVSVEPGFSPAPVSSFRVSDCWPYCPAGANGLSSSAASNSSKAVRPLLGRRPSLLKAENKLTDLLAPYLVLRQILLMVALIKIKLPFR